MKDVKLWIGSLAIMALAGCGNYRDKQAANAKTEYGSATDISKNGELPTNSANVADNGLGGPAQRQSGNYQKRPATAEASDAELAKEIKVALTTGSIGTTGAIAENQLTSIDVRVQNGDVTLSGDVASEAERRTIERQVSGFRGVRSVKNNLTIARRDAQRKSLQPLVPREPEQK